MASVSAEADPKHVIVNSLDSADGALAIKSDVEGHRGQIALGRSSTVRRTKRKSLKTRSKKQGGGDEEPPPVATTTTVVKLMTEMEAGRESIQTQLSCLTALERMVESDAMHRDTACRIRIADPVMNALQLYQDNHNLATTGCWVLANLTTVAATSESIVQSGGVALVIKVMEAHSSADVLHAGCATLCNVAIREQTQQQVYESGAVEAVVRAMKSCPESEWVQYTAIQTIQNICNNGSFCYGVVEKGALEVIQAAMANMGDHDDLLQSACWTLSSLAFATDDACRVSMCKAGAARSVVSALESSPEHTGVQFTGCSALSNLARTEQVLRQMLESKTVPALTHAVSTFPSHLGILAVAYRALVLLSRHEPARQDMLFSNLASLCEQTLNSINEGPAFIEAQQLRRLLEGGTRRCCTVQ